MLRTATCILITGIAVGACGSDVRSGDSTPAPSPSQSSSSSPPASAAPSVTAQGESAPPRRPLLPQLLLPPLAKPDAGPPAPAPTCIQATPDLPQRLVGGPVPDPRCPADPGAPPTLSTGKVVFDDAKDATVTVEIAQSEADEERGLMYRLSMPADDGMIFVFEKADNQLFWMHDTCIPLDMVFIDNTTIVGIEENCATMDDSTYSVGCPSNYVIELNAGWTRAHGVKAGQTVTLEGIP